MHIAGMRFISVCHECQLPFVQVRDCWSTSEKQLAYQHMSGYSWKSNFKLQLQGQGRTFAGHTDDLIED